MLKQISRAPCSQALNSCQKLMRVFALWLCDIKTSSADLTKSKCRKRMPSKIEGEWIWDLLQRSIDKKSLLSRAQSIADMDHSNKHNLSLWIGFIANISQHFTLAPPPNIPTQKPIPKDLWEIFKTLMGGFYTPGMNDLGLPYKTNGKPTKTQKIDYKKFIEDFLQTNERSLHANARKVCVLCGGPLVLAAVDHWIRKSKFPLLAVCENNLLPICGECNNAPNKGQKDVHDGGNFLNWFHPYLRPANGSLQLNYSVKSRSVTCSTTSEADSPRVSNMDKLLNLSGRFTIEYKAEYIRQQSALRQREKRRIQRGDLRHTASDVQDYLIEQQQDLLSSEPHYEVHWLLFTEVLKPSNITLWHEDLGLIQ